MRLVILLASVPLILSAAPHKASAPSASVTMFTPAVDCSATKIDPAEAARNVQPRKLNELPAGKMYLSVYRTRNGCIEPVIVRDNIGQ